MFPIFRQLKLNQRRMFEAKQQLNVPISSESEVLMDAAPSFQTKQLGLNASFCSEYSTLIN